MLTTAVSEGWDSSGSFGELLALRTAIWGLQGKDFVARRPLGRVGGQPVMARLQVCVNDLPSDVVTEPTEGVMASN